MKFSQCSRKLEREGDVSPSRSQLIVVKHVKRLPVKPGSLGVSGAPGKIRTPDLLIRSQKHGL